MLSTFGVAVLNIYSSLLQLQLTELRILEHCSVPDMVEAGWRIQKKQGMDAGRAQHLHEGNLENKRPDSVSLKQQGKKSPSIM